MLHGGNASGAVVRVGDTVRKPWQPSTPRVVEFMDALREAGIDVPRTYGADEQGRLVLEFVPGTMAIDLAPLPLDTLTRVGALVRRIHDASARLPV
ncbi:MAG: aminoglycoside phosphotransferase, partial [Arsenicicoccus sp.]